MCSDDVRPPIPEGIKRAVRQRYRFGCAVCGSPIFDYDHLVPFSKVREHKSENLIILCPNHHSAKTRKRLSDDRLSYYRNNPYNANKSFTSNFDLDKSAEIQVVAGSNELHWSPGEESAICHVIWISGESHFSLHYEDGWLTFSMMVTDELGNILIHVDHGQMSVSSNVWDYEYVGARLKIREGLGKIILDIDIANDHVALHTACFVSGGMGWKVENDGMYAIGTKGNIWSLGGTAHITGSGGGMYGLINNAVFRQLNCPGFVWALEQNIEQNAYLWLSDDSFKRFEQGEIGLKSLEKHWMDQAGTDDLPGNTNALVRGRYYIELTTNERLSGPEGSKCLVVTNIRSLFNVITSAVADLIGSRAETVAYVPQSLLSEYRTRDYGIFVEPDSAAHERSIRLVVHVEGHTGPRLQVKTEGIRRLLGIANSNE
ncbi:HNH endonuclease [Xanthobacter autotrophicus]